MSVDWEEMSQMHKSDKGLTHVGSRERCISIDCLPPLVGVREGDTVRLVLPDRGIDADYIVTSDPDSRAASTVTLTLKASAPADAMSRHVEADEAQDAELRESVAPWTAPRVVENDEFAEGKRYWSRGTAE